MAKRSAALLGRLRTWTGLLSAAAFNLAPLGLNLRSLACPGFNCHGCPWSTMACPIGASAYGSAMRTLPAVAVGTIAAVGLSTGRLVCGFACPFGWFQDLLNRVPLPKFRLPRSARWLKYAALALLVVALPLILGFDVSGYLKVAKPALAADAASGGLRVTVTVTNLGTEPVRGFELAPVYRQGEDGKKVVSREAVQRYPDREVPPGQSLELPSFTIPNRLTQGDLVIESPQSVPQLGYNYYYCRICPNGTLTAALPKLIGGGAEGGVYGGLGRSWLRLGILALFLALMLFVSRPFCQVFCPLGAAYGLASRLALARVTVDRSTCIECEACNRVCPVNLDVPREVGGPECIACGDCIGVCPKSAIRRRIGL